MSHLCEQLIEAAKYLESIQMSRQQLSRLHHSFLKGRQESFKATYGYFDTNKELGKKNINYAERLKFVAAQHKQGEHNIDLLIQQALKKWPLELAI